MYLSPNVVANNFLKHSFEENIAVTPMKLQKLLYILSVEYLKATTKELFSERYNVWKTGPVLLSVSYKFSCYRDFPIDVFAKDAMGQVSLIDESNPCILVNLINHVWNKYKDYSGTALANLLVQNGTAWCNAVTKKSEFVLSEDMIKESI